MFTSVVWCILCTYDVIYTLEMIAPRHFRIISVSFCSSNSRGMEACKFIKFLKRWDHLHTFVVILSHGWLLAWALKYLTLDVGLILQIDHSSLLYYIKCCSQCLFWFDCLSIFINYVKGGFGFRSLNHFDMLLCCLYKPVPSIEIIHHFIMNWTSPITMFKNSLNRYLPINPNYFMLVVFQVLRWATTIESFWWL